MFKIHIHHSRPQILSMHNLDIHHHLHVYKNYHRWKTNHRLNQQEYPTAETFKNVLRTNIENALQTRTVPNAEGRTVVATLGPII